MGRETGISWCDHTFNPWIGCQRVSPGCEHCYAEQLVQRAPALIHGQSGAAVVGLPTWGPGAPRRVTSAKNWREPLRWNRQALQDGVRRRVFCASLCDVFEERPGVIGGLLDETRARLWGLIEECSGLDWLLLTKRPENIDGAVPLRWATGHAWPRHVWIGTTVEDQRRAEERLPHLLRIPAPVRFISAEPLLGELDLSRWLRRRCYDWNEPGVLVAKGCGWEGVPQRGDMCPGCNLPTRAVIHWVIVGGESGPGARPFRQRWWASLNGQCRNAGVPIFNKQAGSHFVSMDGQRVRLADPKGGDPEEWCENLRVRQWPT